MGPQVSKFLTDARAYKELNTVTNPDTKSGASPYRSGGPVKYFSSFKFKDHGSWLNLITITNPGTKSDPCRSLSISRLGLVSPPLSLKIMELGAKINDATNPDTKSGL